MPRGIYPRTEYHKKILSESAKKCVNNSGRFKDGHSYLGDINRPTTFKKGMVSLWKGRHHTRESVRKMLTRRPMSSLEIKMQGIIDKNKLPYRFVGNGDFFIERKNPDFVNINGKKIAIEVYYKKHKERFKGNVETWKTERYNLFKEYGWNLLFFDELEVNEPNILKSIEITGGTK